jgi:hypothetical protein
MTKLEKRGPIYYWILKANIPGNEMDVEPEPEHIGLFISVVDAESYEKLLAERDEQKAILDNKPGEAGRWREKYYDKCAEITQWQKDYEYFGGDLDEAVRMTNHYRSEANRMSTRADSFEVECDGLKATLAERDKLHAEHVQKLEAERFRLVAVNQMLKEALVKVSQSLSIHHKELDMDFETGARTYMAKIVNKALAELQAAEGKKWE